VAAQAAERARHATRVDLTGCLFGAIASVSQHPAQVDDHLIVNVLAGWRDQEFQLGPYLDSDLAIVVRGNCADSFQQ
jgi:hypothetical protein